MKKNFVTTIYGPNFPGIIKALAQATRALGGEWVGSKVIKADGQFAGIMNVVVATDQEKSLKAGLEEKFSSLRFIYSTPFNSFQEGTKTIHLLVDCIDRAGLTGDLSNILSNLDIHVVNMESKRYAMDGIGDMVFSAKLTLEVSETTDSEVIAGEIEALSEDVRVNVI